MHKVPSALQETSGVQVTDAPLSYQQRLHIWPSTSNACTTWVVVGVAKSSLERRITRGSKLVPLLMPNAQIIRCFSWYFILSMTPCAYTNTCFLSYIMKHTILLNFALVFNKPVIDIDNCLQQLPHRLACLKLVIEFSGAATINKTFHSNSSSLVAIMLSRLFCNAASNLCLERSCLMFCFMWMKDVRCTLKANV